MGEPQKLDATELCGFLAEAWAGLRRSVFELVALENTRMIVLSNPKSVLKLLQFVMPRSDPLATHRCEHLEGVPLLLTHGNQLCAFGEENVRFNTDYELLPRHQNLFIHKDAWKVFTDLRGDVDPIGVRQLELDDLLPYKSEIETLAFAEPAFTKNNYLRHLLRFLSMRSQGNGDLFHMMKGWRILPVQSFASGEQVVGLNFVTQTVALTENQQKIEMALLHAGLFLLQSGVLRSPKPFLQSKVVQSDRGVIKLLVAQKDHLVNLTERDRHDLLSHFSLLVISDSSQVPADDIGKLPLFKLASGGFTDLCRKGQKGVVHCCLHPEDKHSHALEQLMPSNAVLLSYPTESTKPIYEFLGIKLCNGEDFMVQFIIPELPTICADSTKADSYLDELREFVVVEKSQKVTEAAKATAFVPNVEGRLKVAESLIHPSKDPVAQLFANCLAADLPADWLHKPRYLALLSKLGLKPFIPAPLLLKCAQDLHSHRDQSVTQDLREKSFHLVETLAHQMATSFSEPLVKAARLHILVTASLASDEELRKEIEKSLTLSGQRKWNNRKNASLRLRPFVGSAFDQCASLLWITCPVALHGYPDHEPVQLEHLSKYHATEMHSLLGAYVAPKDAPFPLLAKHMLKLCSLPHPDEEELCPAPGSRFQEELEACFEEAQRRTWTDSDLKQLSQFFQAGARCIKIMQSDAAEKPENPMILASPRRCFFFKVSESALVAADFQGHLRQADVHFRQLYGRMGVKHTPDLYDLARVTQRVAEKIQHKKGYIMADDKQVLQSCVRGFDCCVQGRDEPDESLEPLKFFLPDQDKKMEEVSKLAWLDMDCWKDRLCHAGAFRFCVFQGEEITDAMLQSLSWAGLKPVSKLVEEITASEVDVLDVHPGSLQDTLRKFFSSPLFSQGFQAMLQSDNGNDCGPVMKMVEEKLQRLVIKSVPRDFRSLLRWIDGQQVLEGSEKKTCAVLQSDQLLISDDAFDIPEKAVNDLFAAFCQMPGLVCCLKPVERPFKEVLELAFNKGPTGIADVLKRFHIANDLDTDMCLGIGDRLPKELHENLNYAMNVAFEVGEYVIAERQSGEFIVARVAPWNDELDGKPRTWNVQRGLLRRYRVQVSKHGYETMRHHCLYKISGGVSQNSGAANFQSYSICLAAAGPGNDAEVVSQNHQVLLDEVKAQLRDMAKMESADYKKALRRLFLRWHPDKSGNTPFNNLIFRMLKRHEAWFRNGGGDDRWLDEFGEAEASQEDAVNTTEESEQGWEEPWAEPEPKAYRAYSRKSSQASWFQEFEEEWKSQKQPPQRQAPTKHSPPVRVWIQPEPQTWTLPRTVNESQASIWLSQAEYDLQTAFHLKDASDSAERPFSSPAVFFASQAVEKALKSAMLRTCGLTTEEFTGQEGHDLEALHLRLKGADPETEPQKLARDQLPGNTSDMAWLKKAYLATRYPNVLGAGQIPALAYLPSDAETACHLAQQVVRWAKNLEDLPPCGEVRRKRARFWTDTEHTEEKTSRVAPAPPSGPVIQEPRPASLPASLPKRQRRTPLRSSTPPPLPPLAARSVKRIRRLSNKRNAQRNKHLRPQMLDQS